MMKILCNENKRQHWLQLSMGMKTQQFTVGLPLPQYHNEPQHEIHYKSPEGREGILILLVGMVVTM
jgi:hypothetical protein